MQQSTDGRWLVGLICATMAWGCRSQPAPVFHAWAERPEPAVIQTGGDNAFDAYARAALDAEAIGGPLLARVHFTNSISRDALKRMAQPLARLEAATSRPCTFRFTPHPPFQKALYQAGWRLLGRCLVWKVQDAVALERWDVAARAAARAMKFGFDLTGGSATDASLGFAIVDEARQAVAPTLEQMGPRALSTLSVGVAKMVERRPNLRQMIENEHLLMLHGVQLVQDAYRTHNTSVLTNNLGSDVKNAVDYLRAMERKDREERPAYFEGFAAEADAHAQWLAEASQQPRAVRRAKPALGEERPWRRFSKQFFEGADPLLAISDATLARTRLLVIEAQILLRIRIKGAAQRDLKGFSGELAVDPFTGQPFQYRADGAMYSVYSVGSNLLDDGGETDESFTTPDLLLERSVR